MIQQILRWPQIYQRWKLSIETILLCAKELPEELLALLFKHMAFANKMVNSKAAKELIFKVGTET